DVGPTTVVVGREAPWLIVHPGPAPRLPIDPAAGAVGGPSRRHGPRHPDLAVGAVVHPAAIGAQVLAPCHRARHLGWRGIAHLAITDRPVGGKRWRHRADDAKLWRVGVTQQFGNLAGLDLQDLAVQHLDLRRAGPDAEPGRLLRGARFHVVVALL